MLLLNLVASAPTAQERQEVLGVIRSNKEAILELRGYQDVIKPGAITATSGRRAVREESLALNRRDLPKFQLLVSSAVRAFPNEEVFESVDHYLRTFESILNSSSLDLETQWVKLLPLCMPNGDRTWVDKTLLKCSSWAQAKQVFARRPPGVGPSNTVVNHEVFAASVVPTAAGRSAASAGTAASGPNAEEDSEDVDQDQLMSELAFQLKRVAMTFQLKKFKYANGIVFEHALDVVQFEQGLDFDVLLGVDVLPKMNIGSTGVAFRIDSEHQHSDATEHDERMFD